MVHVDATLALLERHARALRRGYASAQLHHRPPLGDEVARRTSALRSAVCLHARLDHELGGHYRVFLLWSEELVELHLVVELLLIRDEVTCLGLLDHWFDSFLTDSSLHCV